MPMQQFVAIVVTKRVLKTAARLTLKNAKSVIRTKVPPVAVRNNFKKSVKTG
jgi:hypothetical protein